MVRYAAILHNPTHPEGAYTIAATLECVQFQMANHPTHVVEVYMEVPLFGLIRVTVSTKEVAMILKATGAAILLPDVANMIPLLQGVVDKHEAKKEVRHD